MRTSQTTAMKALEAQVVVRLKALMGMLVLAGGRPIATSVLQGNMLQRVRS